MGILLGILLFIVFCVFAVLITKGVAKVQSNIYQKMTDAQIVEEYRELEKQIKAYSYSYTDRQMGSGFANISSSNNKKWLEEAQNKLRILSVEINRRGLQLDCEELLNAKAGKVTAGKQDASVVGRAVAGGIIAGPAGAVVGAISAADKNAKNKQ